MGLPYARGADGADTAVPATPFLYVIPHDGAFVVYAPLERIAFVAKAAMVALLERRMRGEPDTTDTAATTDTTDTEDDDSPPEGPDAPDDADDDTERKRCIQQFGQKTWTEPCGAQIPKGAVCICNCIQTEQLCICDTIEVPGGRACPPDRSARATPSAPATPSAEEEAGGGAAAVADTTGIRTEAAR